MCEIFNLFFSQYLNIFDQFFAFPVSKIKKRDLLTKKETF